MLADALNYFNNGKTKLGYKSELPLKTVFEIYNRIEQVNQFREFLRDLEKFVDRKITDSALDEDLNILLLPETFMKIRKMLKQEILMLIRQEIERVTV